MLCLERFDELVELLLTGVKDEMCGHVSYIADAYNISQLLSAVNKNTDAIPHYIDFNNFDGCEYYSFSFDYDDNELTYSIAPALDEESDEFYPDYGLCLVDECVPKSFEDDYKKFGKFNNYYESPVRICWEKELEENFEDDADCVKCTYDCDAPCYTKNNKAEVKTKVDTDDNGKVQGFTKSWKDKNSSFTYSYYSSDEDDVLELMKKFKIDQF